MFFMKLILLFIFVAGSVSFQNACIVKDVMKRKTIRPNSAIEVKIPSAIETPDTKRIAPEKVTANSGEGMCFD